MKRIFNSDRTDKLPGLNDLDSYNTKQFLEQYVFNRGLLVPKWIEASGTEEETYGDEADFWKDQINENGPTELCKAKLKGFRLLEWIPRAPGCYHTERAKNSRNQADHYIVERTGGNVVYDPYGKLQMIQGGIGCLRLSAKNINGKNVKFLCATSSGVAHRGILVSLESNLYSKIAQHISKDGAVVCDVSGSLKVWPPDNNLPFEEQKGVPKIYIDVDSVEVIDKHNYRAEYLDVTAAITFSGKYEDVEGVFFTYSHFDPARYHSIDHCIKWLQGKYVKGMHSGRVLTDFDEIIPRFSGSVFPVHRLMDPSLDWRDLKNDFQNSFRLNDTGNKFHLFIKNLNIGDNIMTGDINMRGKGQAVVIGDKSSANVTVSEGADIDNIKGLVEAISSFSGSVNRDYNLAEKETNRIHRALEDIKDEAKDDNADDQTIADSLVRIKDTMEKAGHVYDAAEGWGKKMMKIYQAISIRIPTLLEILPF